MTSLTFSWAQGGFVQHMSRGVSCLLILALAWVVAREDPQALGVLGLFLAVEACVLALCSGGGVVLARRASHFGAALGPALSALVLASLALGVGLASVLGILSFWATSSYAWLWLLALGLPWLLLVPNVSGLWLGRGKVALVAWLDLAGPAVALLGWGLAVALGAPNNLLTVLLMWVLGRSLVGWLCLVGALHGTGWASPGGAWLRAQVPPLLGAGFGQMLAVVSHRVDLLIVEHHLGLQSAGMYFLAYALAAVLVAWAVGGARALGYRVTCACVTPDAEVFAVVRVLYLSFMLAAVLTPVWWVLSGHGVHWGLDADFYEVTLPLMVVLISLGLTQAGVGLLCAFLVRHAGRPWTWFASGVTGVGALLNIILAWWSVGRWGLTGVAWSGAACQLALLLCVMVLFKAQTRLSWLGFLEAEAVTWRTFAAELAFGWRRRRMNSEIQAVACEAGAVSAAPTTKTLD